MVVRGAGASRVRLIVKRGKQTVIKRTIRSRENVARVVLKLGRGTYRFSARTLDGVALKGSSKTLRVR